MIATSKFAMGIPPTYNGNGDDHVTCRMCLVQFSYPHRVPLSLNCLHTFCEFCISAWTQGRTKLKLTCPICSKQTKIDRGRTPQDCLPVNHAVLELASVAANSQPPARFVPHNGQGQAAVGFGQPFEYADNSAMITGQGQTEWVQMNGNIQQMRNHAQPLPQINGYNAQGDFSAPNQPGLIPAFAADNNYQQNSYPNLAPLSQNSWSPNNPNQMGAPHQQPYNVPQQQLGNGISFGQGGLQPGVVRPVSSNYQLNDQVSGDALAANGVGMISNLNLGDSRYPNTAAACECRSSPNPNRVSTPVIILNNGNTSGYQDQKSGKTCGDENRLKDLQQESLIRRNDSPGCTDSTAASPENPNSGAAVTAVAVNQSVTLNGLRSTPEPPKVKSSAKVSADTCVKCNTNPAKVTVNDSQAKLTQRLCIGCYEASKEEKKAQEHHSDKGLKSHSHGQAKTAADVAGNQGRTVVKVEDKNAPKNVVQPSMNSSHKHNSVKQSNPSKTREVLKLGDPLKLHTSSAAVNQVAVNCGPFKTELSQSQLADAKESKFCACQPSNTGNQPIEAHSHGALPLVNGRRVDLFKNEATVEQPVATTIDLGTVERVRITKKSNTKHTETRSRAREERREVRDDPPEQTVFRPREYIVAPAAHYIGDNARPNRRTGETTNRQSTESISRGTNRIPQPVSIYEARRQEAYNPNYDETMDDSRSLSDLGLSTVSARNPLITSLTKEQEAMQYNNSGNGQRNREKQSQALQVDRMYPTLSAPPRYDEVVAQTNGTTAGQSGVRCVKKFGKYGEISTQPGAFKLPTRISFSPDNKAVIVDPGNKTVQVFDGSTGECLSLIRVDGINGCCLINDGSLAVATSRGVEVYNLNGTLIKKVAMGPVVNTVRFESGFVAIQPQALVAFKDMDVGVSKTLAYMIKPGQYNQSIPFQNITDIAINSQQDLVVLDAGSIYTITEDGFIKSVINPSQESCSSLRNPSAVAVDQSHNVLVSDSGNKRVLLFGANGRYKQTILDSKTLSKENEASRKIADSTKTPIGVDISPADQAFVVTRGTKSAEVLVLSYT